MSFAIEAQVETGHLRYLKNQHQKNEEEAFQNEISSLKKEIEDLKKEHPTKSQIPIKRQAMSSPTINIISAYQNLHLKKTPTMIQKTKRGFLKNWGPTAADPNK